MRKAGEEEDWKKRTRYRGGWKRLSDEAVKKMRAARHPLTKDKGPFKCYVTQMGVGGGGVRFSGKKRYDGVMFHVISVTRGWVGVQFPGK